MNRRIVWPVAGVLGLAVLVLSISGLPAQRPINMPTPGLHSGRFVVAHATPTRVIILDSATGQVYAAGERDFKPMSELPRPGEGSRPPFMQRDKDKDNFSDKDRKEDRPRERRSKDKEIKDISPPRRFNDKDKDKES
jgi:hypothetical protein